MRKLSVKDLDLKGKRVLMRVDFNVSLNKETGEITDDTKIKASLPTINYVLNQGASLILMSHLGRPKGKVVPQLRMDKVARRLEELLGKKVLKLDECVGERINIAVKSMKAGQVILLENTRFYPGETKNDPEFARKLASLGDIFVNDAFGTAHRSHASTVGVANYLPAAAGLLMSKEMEVLGGILTYPRPPFVAILGGAKVSDKIGVLENLLSKCQNILIGGGMAYTFLRAKEIPTGKSLVEEDKIEEAKKIMEQTDKKNCQILLPSDHIVAPEAKSGVKTQVVGQREIPSDWIALDIGPKTIDSFSRIIAKSATVFWNGPLGMFEVEEFSRGTQAIARKLAESKADVVVGGGDSIAALKKGNLLDKITHVSTGGGASLEFLEGKQLPGVSVLNDKK
ncbi:phosphoglycerate kinase [Patescibacteria group bacterium]|nr:phosphoglycerate kinase [Patescibacteria group bacterium]